MTTSQSQKDYFWSLIVEPQYVQAALWTIEGQSTHVLSVGPSTSWDTDEDLINAADTTLSSAITDFGEELEPTKTVFGVPPSWISEGQISKEILDKLRILCDKLSLEPTGFVVLPEAIAHFIKSEEGVPLNGIVIGLGSQSLDIALFKLGNLAGIVQVSRSVSIVEDVIEGLTRFGITDPLPSRILLYNGKTAELEETKQILIQADWTDVSDKIKFLHTPAVEIIDPEKKTIAVCLAGASEIGDVKKVIFPKLVKDEHLKSEKEEQNLVQHITPSDIGFVMGKDIDDQNISNVTAADELPENIASTLRKKNSIDLKNPVLFINKVINRVKEAFPTSLLTPPRQLSHPIYTDSEPFKKPVVLSGVVVIILVIVGFVAWWFLPKAQITIFISPKLLQSTHIVSLDSTIGSVDPENKIIPSRYHEIVVSGERTAEATGRKKIGDKAKGSVTIRNGTAVAIKVAAGTILVGANDLKFSTDSSASVSAALSPSNPGMSTISVTAESIGSEYNLAKDETLKVGNYPRSDVDSVVDQDLTGGSSRDITVVSLADQKKLEEDLTAELLDQARVQLKSEIGLADIFIEESLTAEPAQKKFSNKVGDEATAFKLSLNLKIKALVVKKDDMDSVAMRLLDDQIPDGFVLREDQIKTEFLIKEKQGDKWQFDTEFSANLLPEVKPDEIKDKIAGKTQRGALEVLDAIPGFVRAQIKLSPQLPGKLAIIPRVLKNISIEISAE